MKISEQIELLDNFTSSQSTKSVEFNRNSIYREYQPITSGSVEQCQFQMNLDLVVQIVLAVATLFAVVIALYQEKIKEWWNKSRLMPEIKLEPPDCHQIELHNPTNGQSVGKSIYIRIRVRHVGGNSAKEVEAIISKVEMFEDGSWKIVKSFLPMNLKWSHTHEQKVVIPPQSFRHCDLGSFSPLYGNGSISNMFKIDTIVQPNPVSSGMSPNILQPGIYRLEVLFTGENVQPITKKWKVSFNASWYQSEQRMLEIIEILDVSE